MMSFDMCESGHADGSIRANHTPADSKVCSSLQLNLNSTDSWSSGFSFRKRKPILSQTNRQRIAGWVVGMGGVVVLASIAFIINCVFLIYGLRRGDLRDGHGTLMKKECSKVNKANRWLHLMINVLSTGLLSGSNYCMQRLSAPSRTDIDKAHRKYTALDIGVPSIKNLRYVNKYATLAWLGFALSSIPLHLMYNSAVFSQVESVIYTAYVVDPSFLTGADFNLVNAYDNSGLGSSYISLSNAPLDRVRSRLPTLKRMSPSDCAKTYARDFVTGAGDVLLVVRPKSTPPKNSLLAVTAYSARGDDFYWLCNQDQRHSRACTVQKVLSSAPLKVFKGYEVDYCLVQEQADICRLQFSPLILMTVIICNVIKLALAILIIWKSKEEPLVVLGDYVGSLLQRPDDVSKDMCLANNYMLKKKDWHLHKSPSVWRARRQFWFAAVSKSRWSLCYFTSLLGLGCASLTLVIGIAQTNYTSLADLYTLGVGEVRASTIVSTSFSFTVLTGVLLANVPQLILSMLYFTFNSLFTSELLAQEWSDLAHKRRTLRVSKALGAQRSTYWLSLPFKYAIPLSGVSILLHWLYSQSLFFVDITFREPSPETPSLREQLSGNVPDLVSVGFSPFAIFLSILISGLILVVGIGFGFRKYQAGIPLATCNSIAIAAACHPPANEPCDSAQRPLKWGVTSAEVWATGHCSISSGEVTFPKEGSFYQ